nr:TetR/AcrR family transcriptional regulator C-terminal domain-containing protein [Streptomyces tateyamensis]
MTPLAGTGLTAAEQTDAVTVLTGHVRTITQQQAAAPAAGAVEEQLAAGLARVLAEHGDRYPQATAALTGAAPAERNQAWTFGLRRILGGPAELIAARQ